MRSRELDVLALLREPKLAAAFKHIAREKKTTVDLTAKTIGTDTEQAIKLLGELESAKLVAATNAPLPQLRLFYLTKEGFLAEKDILP